MSKFFNKKIENKFIDKLLVKFYIFFLFFMPFVVLFYLLFNYPYKETFICNSNKCSLEQQFLFSNSSIVNLNRPKNVKVHCLSTRRVTSYALMFSENSRLFHSTYYIPYFAYIDRDLIKSGIEKIKITKYNQDIFLVLMFNIMIVLLLIYGKINYIKKHKKILEQTLEDKSL